MKKKNINRLLACICLLFCMMPQLLNAQRRVPMNMQNYDNEPYHFGFIVGYNQMMLSPKYIENYEETIHTCSETIQGIINKDDQYKVPSIAPTIGHGFSVGIVGNLRLNNYFDLRLIPSLSYGHTNINYELEGAIAQKNNYHANHVIIEFPLQIKYKSKRCNNYRAYIITGANYKCDAYSRKSIQYITDRQDIALEIGSGFDFYTTFFKLGIEIKMSYGLLNVFDKNEKVLIHGCFDSLHNKTFQLSFTFE